MVVPWRTAVEALRTSRPVLSESTPGRFKAISDALAALLRLFEISPTVPLKKISEKVPVGSRLCSLGWVKEEIERVF
ncbi:MAG: hypothetical protein ACRCTK_04875 [Alphaproteobacteria bacterium]